MALFSRRFLFILISQFSTFRFYGITFFFFFKMCFHLFEGRVIRKKRHTKRSPLLHSWCQASLMPRGWTSICIIVVGAGAIFCRSPRHVSRAVDWKWSTLDYNCFSNGRKGIHRQQFNTFCHDASLWNFLHNFITTDLRFPCVF